MVPRNFLYLITAIAIGFGFSLALYGIGKWTQPTANVRAKHAAQTPQINPSDFEPGDVKILNFNNLPIIAWRRSEADQILAARQNLPSDWKQPFSEILGQAEPVLAEDSNLTLNGEWFFAVAYPPQSPRWILLPRAGNFGGFFDVRLAGHYDLAGRIRRQGSAKNLTIVKSTLSEDGQSILLDLRRQK